MRKHLKKEGAQIFLLWGHSKQFELDVQYPPPKCEHTQPVPQTYVPRTYLPIPVQDDERPVQSVTPDNELPEQRQSTTVRRSRPHPLLQQQILRRRLESLHNRRRQLYAILKNGKLEASSRARFLAEKAQTERELAICHLQWEVPTKYWRKLLSDEAIKAEAMTPEQVTAIPQLQEVLEAAVIFTDSHTDLERERTKATAAADQISTEAQELNDHITRQSQQLQFLAEALRRSEIRTRIEQQQEEVFDVCI
jgi:hypothetical protein